MCIRDRFLTEPNCTRLKPVGFCTALRCTHAMPRWNEAERFKVAKGLMDLRPPRPRWSNA
eukprot:13304998-Alexandrium_andersonii.AAC.1